MQISFGLSQQRGDGSGSSAEIRCNKYFRSERTKRWSRTVLHTTADSRKIKIIIKQTHSPNSYIYLHVATEHANKNVQQQMPTEIPF